MFKPAQDYLSRIYPHSTGERLLWIAGRYEGGKLVSLVLDGERLIPTSGSCDNADAVSLIAPKPETLFVAALERLAGDLRDVADQLEAYASLRGER